MEVKLQDLRLEAFIDAVLDLKSWRFITCPFDVQSERAQTVVSYL